MTIAKSILNHIDFNDRGAFSAWKASGFYLIRESKKYQGGVGFKVNGFIHKGWVSVKLHSVGDYTITFTDKFGKVVKTVEGAIQDELIGIIDFVEGR